MNVRFFHFCFLLSAFCFPAAGMEWTNPDAVVAAAIAASPAMREIDAQLAAARARVKSAGALPNPMLMGGVQNEPVNLSRDFMTMYMVGASQTLVRRSRRSAVERLAALDVQRVEAEAASRRAEVARDVLTAWHEVAAAQSQIGASEQLAALAGTMAEAARIRYESGGAPQIDIIRAKLEQNDVQHEILMQRGRREQGRARLRALLALPSDAEIPTFSIAEHHGMSAHQQPAPVSLAASTPAIAALQAEADRAAQDIEIARLASRPDIAIEASYGFRPRETDMVSVTGRIELPIRRSTNIEPRVAEALARRDAALAQIEMLRQQLRSELGVAVAERNEAIEQINLHVERLVPEAKLGFESALAAYQSGSAGFESLLGALQTYRRLDVDYFDFLRRLHTAEVQIDAIQGGAR